MIVYAKLVNRSRVYIHNKKLTFKSIFFGWIAKEVLITGSKYILMLTVLLYALTELSMIDLTKLRLIGDNWEIDSVAARIKLVQDLFIKHFNFAPVFGNMTVNSIMGDQYVHSLLAFLVNFFTWIPLWFAFGLFASSFISPRNRSTLQSS